ncbi:hypothetical protein KUH03_03965 [Sphingobacterium sp. E70]|nr:hypothetical protein [Sphingobacterium sp. E70]ULT26114.1 hypothetical protein KUH03_03965 [Sphingobacterium sp. E70]
MVRAAIEHAIHYALPSVTIVHKGNIMKYTEGAFKIWGFEVAETEFADKTYTWGNGSELKRRKVRPRPIRNKKKPWLRVKS